MVFNAAQGAELSEKFTASYDSMTIGIGAHLRVLLVDLHQISSNLILKPRGATHACWQHQHGGTKREDDMARGTSRGAANKS